MSRTSILAILAGAGITFSGLVTTDAVAFARAIQSENDSTLTRFANEFPNSVYKSDALKLAEVICKGNWVNAGCTVDPTGGQGGAAPAGYGADKKGV